MGALHPAKEPLGVIKFVCREQISFGTAYPSHSGSSQSSGSSGKLSTYGQKLSAYGRKLFSRNGFDIFSCRPETPNRKRARVSQAWVTLRLTKIFIKWLGLFGIKVLQIVRSDLKETQPRHFEATGSAEPETGNVRECREPFIYGRVDVSPCLRAHPGNDYCSRRAILTESSSWVARSQL